MKNLEEGLVKELIQTKVKPRKAIDMDKSANIDEVQFPLRKYQV